MQLDICLTFLYHCKQKYIQMAHIQGETVCKTAITFMYNYENFQTFIHLPFKQKNPNTVFVPQGPDFTSIRKSYIILYLKIEITGKH